MHGKLEDKMLNVMRAAGAFVLAASVAAPALAMTPGKVLGTAVVDGFTVNELRFPTVARLMKPTVASGAVTTGTNATGTNPYDGSALAGAPFLSLDNGGSVTYVLKHPAAWVALIWGTPDSYNYVSLYDTSGALIGTLNGGDISTAFGFSYGHYLQIVSPKLVGSVAASSAGCCFEMGNQAARGGGL